MPPCDSLALIQIRPHNSQRNRQNYTFHTKPASVGRGAWKRDEDWQLSSPRHVVSRANPLNLFQYYQIGSRFYGRTGQYGDHRAIIGQYGRQPCRSCLPSPLAINQRPFKASCSHRANYQYGQKIHCRLKDFQNYIFFLFSGSSSCSVRNHFHGSFEPDRLLLPVSPDDTLCCGKRGRKLKPPPRLEPYPPLSTSISHCHLIDWRKLKGWLCRVFGMVRHHHLPKIFFRIEVLPFLNWIFQHIIWWTACPLTLCKYGT